MTVRVRIAPSPTGAPHVGTAYIGLLNWCLARQHGGAFVLRIEDTDQTRCTPAAETAILAALHWLGLDYDEGPDVAGPYGPYRQSERVRTGIYREHAEQLLEAGHAYRCFCTPERLAAVRQAQVEAKSRFQGYDRHCRDLDPAAAADRAAAGEACVVRMKTPLEGAFTHRDRLRKDPFSKRWAELDDQVLLKADGWPTYHLAAVVDDASMRISHVVRAEEWLNSLPKHVWLGQRLALPIPEYVHVGLLRNADRSKISKRKNPTDILWYKRRGFLPGALTNFLALLGHSHPDGREFFDRDELVRIFSLDRLSVGGPVFDLQKLEHLQGLWLRELGDDELKAEIHRCLDERLDELLPLLRPRLTFGGDATWLADFVFRSNVEPAREALVPKGWDRAGSAAALGGLLKAFTKALKKGTLTWQAEALEAFVRNHVEEAGHQTRPFFMALRVAVCGRTESPPLFASLAAVGQQAVLARLDQAVARLR